MLDSLFSWISERSLSFNVDFSWIAMNGMVALLCLFQVWYSRSTALHCPLEAKLMVFDSILCLL
jgi:hypothetical protein